MYNARTLTRPVQRTLEGFLLGWPPTAMVLVHARELHTFIRCLFKSHFCGSADDVMVAYSLYLHALPIINISSSAIRRSVCGLRLEDPQKIWQSVNKIFLLFGSPKSYLFHPLAEKERSPFYLLCYMENKLHPKV